MTSILSRLEALINERRHAAADGSYVASLQARGLDTILKKIGEEAAETIIASKNGQQELIIAETADLIFHLLVMLGQHNISFEAVLAELERREGTSGHAEKASRKLPEQDKYHV